MIVTTAPDLYPTFELTPEPQQKATELQEKAPELRCTCDAFCDGPCPAHPEEGYVYLKEGQTALPGDEVFDETTLPDGELVGWRLAYVAPSRHGTRICRGEERKWRRKKNATVGYPIWNFDFKVSDYRVLGCGHRLEKGDQYWGIRPERFGNPEQRKNPTFAWITWHGLVGISPPEGFTWRRANAQAVEAPRNVAPPQQVARTLTLRFGPKEHTFTRYADNERWAISPPFAFTRDGKEDTLSTIPSAVHAPEHIRPYVLSVLGIENCQLTVLRMWKAAALERVEQEAKKLPGPGTHCEWDEP